MPRAPFDPLERCRHPRCYTVPDLYAAQLEARELLPVADLKRAFVEAIFKQLDAGWKLKEFSSRTGTFFCDRGAAAGWSKSGRTHRKNGDLVDYRLCTEYLLNSWRIEMMRSVNFGRNREDARCA